MSGPRLKERAARLNRRITELAAREAGYLKEDVKKVRRAVTRSRISHLLLIGGAVVIVYSIAQWLPVPAGIVAGVFTIVYGLIFVDLDAPEAPRRRGRR